MIKMLRARTTCPNCGNNQDFVSYKVKKKSQINNCRKKCVYCGKSYKLTKSKFTIKKLNKR